MTLYGTSAAKPTESLPAIAAYKRRIQERMKGGPSHHRAEPPTLAYHIVYFTTVALLLTLCVVSTLR